MVHSEAPPLNLSRHHGTARHQSSQCLEPQIDWLPLAQAVFKFGIEAVPVSDNGGCPVPPAFTMTELAALLQEKTGADRVEIDPEASTFEFGFALSSGSWWATNGPPWTLLKAGSGQAEDVDPHIEAEALFSKGRLVRLSDEEAASTVKRAKSIREATALVWHQFMSRAFDRAIAAKRVVLYARVGSTGSAFDQLPADVWPNLKVVDWQNAVAVAPDGLVYWSIHAAKGPATASAETAQSAARRRPKREAARKAIEALYPEGVPDQATEVNATLCRRVGAWLKDHEMSDANDDTILRAAGRRK